jgi:NodT family efflux transporter outer membrane factor (OMF) lipoprotein
MRATLLPLTSGRAVLLLGLLVLAVPLAGCTSPLQYLRNGFKVGPNYGKPPAPVSEHWIDAADKRVRSETDDLSKWWTVFNDPVLNELICFAYNQNLTLREAGFRVLQARAQYGIALGELLPQTQTMTGGFDWHGSSAANIASAVVLKRWAGTHSFGFNLAWELDFWGRYRRAVESASDTLDASVEDYDDVLVTLLSDIATNYVTMRSTELRIKYARRNVELEQESVDYVVNRRKAGILKELDVDQVRSILAQTQALIPELEITLRQTIDQLCILLGIPPEDLLAKVGSGPIPKAPVAVAVGIPADLLRRRPDVRRAERQAAAQCATIGIAESDFYPRISLVGNFGYSAEFFKDLFTPAAFNGQFGPQFTWNILNYGRILNNVRLQDAHFQELVAAYQQAVLQAQREVEDGLATFLKAQQRFQYQSESVKHAEHAYTLVKAQFDTGVVDQSQLILILQNLVQFQDTLAIAQGEIPTGLIQVYKALGGGWQIRLTGCDPMPGGLAPPEEALPTPRSKLGGPVPSSEGPPVNPMPPPDKGSPPPPAKQTPPASGAAPTPARPLSPVTPDAPPVMRLPEASVNQLPPLTSVVPSNTRKGP